MLKCARCQKPLTRAYVQEGPFAWGPKCAKASGLTRPTGPRIKAPEPQSKDDAQMSLELRHAFAPRPTIQPGHKYSAQGIDAPLIAIEPQDGAWRMREIDGEWLGASHLVFAGDADPLPMKYFHGNIPA